ncbi:MAG: DNA polymerase [Candidatus Jorgensenbacteria bacterium]
MKTLLLIDAHAIIHRAFHALPPLTSPEGEPVGALYGLARTLNKVLEERKPDYVAAAFDRPEPTLRKEAFKEYKAHRPKAPDELVSQLIKARELFKAFQIPIFERPGSEADDIIGTLVERFKNNPELRIVILTGDLDALQLVVENRVVVEAMKKGVSEMVTYDDRAVKARYGLPVSALVDYKGLVGDPSDNIPGVKGVGPKTAEKLLKEFGTLENIFEQMKPTHPLAQKILPFKEQAFFAKKLATIDRYIPLEVREEELLYKPAIKETLTPLFEKLGFKSLIRDTVEKPSPEKRLSKKGGAGQLRGIVVIDAASARSLSMGEQNSNIPKVAYDWKNIIKELMEYGTPVPSPLFDIKIGAWLLNPDEEDFSLAALETRYLGQNPSLLPRATEKAVKDMASVLSQKIQEEGLGHIFNEIEMPLVPVLAAMERHGIAVDAEMLRELKVKIESELEKLAGDIYREAGAAFNINSPKQVSEVIFGTLKLGDGHARKTATGQLRTGRDVLEELEHTHPIVPLLLRYRENSKVLSGFIEPLLAAIEKDGRVHTTFLQTGTGTGRLSSENPNLQNIPQESEWAKPLRQAFQAPQGHTFLSFDYSQLELRLLAHLTQDPNLLAAFRAGDDIHALTASHIFGVPRDRVSSPMRRVAKTLNFGVIYGMGARAFSKTSGLNLEEAKRFIDAYFSHFAKVRDWQKQVKEKAQKLGFVKNENGRKRWFVRASGTMPALGEFERAAINMPLQSLAADILKIAMVKVAEVCKGKKADAVLVLSIHDELLFEVPDATMKQIAPILRDTMEHAYELSVPLVVQMKHGEHWGDMELLS